MGARVASSKFENVAPKQPAIAEGVRTCVENLLDPKFPALLPCGTGARVFPTYYHIEESLVPADVENAFNGVAVLRPHRNDFLSIDVDNGLPIDLISADLPGTSLVNKGAVYFEGARYSPVFTAAKSGITYAKSTLRPVGGPIRYFGQDDTGKWIEGFVNVIEGDVGTSSNANFSNLVFNTEDTSGVQAVDIGLGEINLTDGQLTRGAVTAVAAGTTTTGSIADLAGTSTGYISYYLEGTTTIAQGQIFNMKCAFGSIDLNNLDQDVRVLPPTPEDAIYNTLTSHATKFRLDCMSLLFQFRGSDMTNAGSVAIALVPEGTNLPLSDPAACYAAIAKLPYDKYTGPIKNGAHCYWRPATIRELLFAENGVRDPQLISNYIVVAWLSPATTAGQPPQVTIKVDSVWEWIFDSQSLPQFRAPFGWAFLEALYCVISQYNPAGENPGHRKKVAQIAKAAANNPVLRKLGTDALALGMDGVKKLLPAIMGGLLI